MRMKTFQAATMSEAMALVRDALGDEAIIVSTHSHRDGGGVEKWMIEAGSPNTLVRRGMTRDSIPAGTEVVVFGYRHRNGSNAANGRDVTLPDGRRLFITSPGTGAPGGDPPAN